VGSMDCVAHGGEKLFASNLMRISVLFLTQGLYALLLGLN